MLICSVCRVVTELENDCIEKLRLVIVNKIEKKKENTRPSNELMKNADKQNLFLPQPRCKIHNDEILNYFCLKCTNSLVCSECIIHGDHKEHKVISIRKASPPILSKLNEIASKFDIKINQMEKQSRIFVSKNKFIGEKINNLKNELSTQTKITINNLQNMEKQWINILDEYYSLFISDRSKENQVIEKRIEKTKNIRDSIQNLIRDENIVIII